MNDQRQDQDSVTASRVPKPSGTDAASYRYSAELPETSRMLQQLLSGSEIQQLMASYHNLIRIPVAIVDLEANVLLSSAWLRICTQFHRANRQTCERCFECDTKLSAQIQEGQTHTVYECLNGLTDCASPIIIEGVHVANVFVGQFLTQAADQERFRQQAVEFGFDVEDYLSALREVPVVNKEEIPGILDLLVRMTRAITNLAVERKHAVEERTRQSLILNTIPQGVFWKDLQGRFLGCNETFAKAAGLASPQEILGKTDFDLPWPIEEAEAYRTDDREVIAGNQPRLHIIEPMNKADGSRIVIDTSKVPLCDESGVPYGIVGIFSDITQRLKTQEALASSEALVRGILQNVQDAYLRADLEGRVIMASPSAVTMYGFDSMEELLGVSAVELYASEEDRRNVLAGLNAHGKMRDHIGKARRKDGSVFWVSQNAQVCRNERGQIIGTETFVRDISDRRRREEELHDNELKYRSLFDSADDAIMLFDEGKLIDCNRAALSMYRATREQLLGMDPAASSPPTQPDGRSSQEAARQKVELAFTQGPQFFEWTHSRMDGTPFLAEVTLKRLDLAGKPMLQAVVRDVTARKMTDLALLESEERFRSLLQNLRVGVVAHAPDTSVRLSNPMASKLLGLTPEQMLGKAATDSAWWFVDEAGSKLPADQYPVNRALASFQAVEKQILGIHRSESEPVTWVQCDSNAIRDPDGQVRQIIVTFFDITDRKQAEEAKQRLSELLRASQKMEAIGSLAGGVAHDFNNLLSVILSYTGFVMESMSANDPRKGDLAEVAKAADRAVTLTRQLLAFSRKQVLQPKPLDLNHVASGVEKMLRRILGEDIDFVQVLAPDLGLIMADQGQIEQVIMNLSINARDAMPHGGRLTIRTSNVELDGALAASLEGVTPGSFVELVVTDTGVGIEAQHQARIFEPFFTTKEKGKGTGLGLSTVFGIVKQSGGDIRVESEPGRGTSFRILLPRHHATRLPATGSANSEPVHSTGTETILVVEDEEALRFVAHRVLTNGGYHVLAAPNGQEALRLCEEHCGQIHLVLTDVIMPEMSGKMLADQLSQRFPGIKVLFMSGYTDDAIAHHGVLDEVVHFIPKPFASTALTRKVREVLDSGPARQSPQ